MTGRDGHRGAAPPPGLSPIAPVFILGNHRSGTTWVHQLLAETGRVDYLAAYHVVAYESLAGDPLDLCQARAYRSLAVELDRLGIERRGFDDVPITPAAPEEYNFVLSNAGTGGRITPHNLGLFLDMCGRIRRAPDTSRPLVVKNPWDFSNFLAIKRALPEARFVFVHRHPAWVIQSTLRTARTLLRTKHPYLALLSREYDQLYSRPLRLRALRLLIARRYDVGVRLVTGLVADAGRYFVRHAAALHQEDALTLRYEDLCADPGTYRSRIFAFCGVDPATAPDAFTPPRPRPADLSEEVRRWGPAIERSTSGYMRLLGYFPAGRAP
jgi:hypothetical protein